MLITAGQQSDSVLCIYAYLYLFLYKYSFLLEEVVGYKYSSLCCAVGPCCLSVLRTRVKVYTCRPSLPLHPPRPLPAGSRKSVLYVCCCFRREAPSCPGLDPTCKRRPVKFLCLTSLSVRTSRSVHAAARGVMTTSRSVRAGRAASFRSSLWLSSTPPRVHCIFFIHSSAGTSILSPEWLYQFPFPPTVEEGSLLCTPQRMWF